MGNGGGMLEDGGVLGGFVLVLTDPTAIACGQIRWQSWIGGDLCLWRQDHQVVGWPPVLADDLVAPDKGGLRRRAQEDQGTGRQQKTTAHQGTFTRLSSQLQKDVLPHVLNLSYRVRDEVQEMESSPHLSYIILLVQAIQDRCGLTPL